MKADLPRRRWPLLLGASAFTTAAIVSVALVVPTSAAFTDQDTATVSAKAGVISSVAAVNCSSLLGLAVGASWAPATPAAAAPVSYRYIVDLKPYSTSTFAVTATAPSVSLPNNLLGLTGDPPFRIRVELLSGGTTLWTGPTAFFKASTLITTSCTLVTPTPTP